MPFLHGAICLRCFTCIFIQTKNPSCMLSLSTSLYNKALSYNEALSISLTKSFKKSRPMSLWESNPLVLAYQAKSFSKTELLLRVLNKLASLEEFHLPSFWDSWTYGWRLLSICSLLAVWSKLNQQPIPSHLPHQRESCKQVSPAFVTYSTSFLMQMSLCSVEFWTMRHGQRGRTRTCVVNPSV